MESFFGIGLPELVLILIIAGIVMGPERIAVAARWLGRTSAQLQAISRGFLSQLNAEIDGLQGSDEVRSAMQEMQDLRSQLDQLKRELTSVANGTVKDSKRAARETREQLERTIAPPAKRAPAANHEGVPVPEGEGTTPNTLPNRVDVPDDPE